MLESIFRQNTPSGDITGPVEVLKLVVLLQREQVRIKSYALFRIIMGFVKSDDRLWPSARLAMEGAYSSTDGIPPTGDLNDLLDFLCFHISPRRRATIGDEPVYHVFRSIVINASVEKRRGLAAYNFDIPFFVDAMIQLLSNRDNMPLQRMSLLILPELDDLLFASEAAFGDSRRAEEFVLAWSTAVGEFLRGKSIPQTDIASVNGLLAIANLPCLRVHLPPERWDLVYKFPVILYLDSPSMRRCIQNPDILPFVKQSTGGTGALGWLGMLWMMYHSLPKSVRAQLEEETRVIGSGPRYFDLDSYVSLFDSELDRLQARIGRLEPLDQSVPGLRSELDEMARAKDRLVEIRKEKHERKERAKRERLSSQRQDRQVSLQSEEGRVGSQLRTFLGIT